jgi:hypothetical protein
MAVGRGRDRMKRETTLEPAAAQGAPQPVRLASLQADAKALATVQT